MDGFISQAADARKGCLDQTNPACTFTAVPDVMGYHTESDIPNYWTYAKDFVLQDHMFEPNASWSLPAHLFLVSEWSAYCTEYFNRELMNHCRRGRRSRRLVAIRSIIPTRRKKPLYAWTDLTWLLHKYGVSWRYYIVPGTEPDCENTQPSHVPPSSRTPARPVSGTRCPTSTRCVRTAS